LNELFREKLKDVRLLYFQEASKVIQSKAQCDMEYKYDYWRGRTYLVSLVKYTECDTAITMSVLSIAFLITDEREDVQKKTFAKWINSQLLKVSMCR